MSYAVHLSKLAKYFDSIKRDDLSKEIRKISSQDDIEARLKKIKIFFNKVQKTKPCVIASSRSKEGKSKLIDLLDAILNAKVNALAISSLLAGGDTEAKAKEYMKKHWEDNSYNSPKELTDAISGFWKNSSFDDDIICDGGLSWDDELSSMML